MMKKMQAGHNRVEGSLWVKALKEKKRVNKCSKYILNYFFTPLCYIKRKGIVFLICHIKLASLHSLQRFLTASTYGDVLNKKLAFSNPQK